MPRATGGSRAWRAAGARERDRSQHDGGSLRPQSRRAKHHAALVPAPELVSRRRRARRPAGRRPVPVGPRRASPGRGAAACPALAGQRLLEAAPHERDARAREVLAQYSRTERLRLGHDPLALGIQSSSRDEERRASACSPLVDVRERRAGGRLAGTRRRAARRRSPLPPSVLLPPGRPPPPRASTRGLEAPAHEPPAGRSAPRRLRRLRARRELCAGRARSRPRDAFWRLRASSVVPPRPSARSRVTRTASSASRSACASVSSSTGMPSSCTRISAARARTAPARSASSAISEIWAAIAASRDSSSSAKASSRSERTSAGTASPSTLMVTAYFGTATRVRREDPGGH